MKISFVIPAYNEEACIGDCIDSILKNFLGKPHEIIVVDNASTDRTGEIASSRPEVRALYEKRKGPNNARQTGLEAATGDFVAYMDADTRLPPGWAEKAEKIFSREEHTVALSGPGRYWDATFFQKIALEMLWWLSAPLTYRFVGYMIYGANFIARKDALLRAGGFDRNISFYGDDTDVAQRLSREGKVRFKMSFFIYSSARRFASEGMLKTSFLYSMNFLWPIIFKRPFTEHHQDIRRTET